MPRYMSLDDIFDEPDGLGLLDVQVKARATRETEAEKTAAVIREISDFFERTGRPPDPGSASHDEMRLGVMPEKIRERDDLEDFAAEDPHEVLTGGAIMPPAAPDVRSWREEPEDDEIPQSLDDIFADDDLEVSASITTMHNVTPMAERNLPDHRAEFYPCENFPEFQELFENMQAALDAGEREVQAVHHNEAIEVHEGGFFIRKGLLTYVAEKSEMTARGGKHDYRLRIIFSNGTESDPLLSSFRKALADDPTARIIHRHGLGPLDPDWEADKLELTGTIYVARSLSTEPQIADISRILHKIGVTSQDVSRRVADARNDPTFLMAPVEIVATYELKNLSRKKIEDLLHRFFDGARPRDLWVMDRFGRKVYPREWFYVLPEHVSRAVCGIQEGTLHQLEYDPRTQVIIKKRDAPS